MPVVTRIVVRPRWYVPSVNGVSRRARVAWRQADHRVHLAAVGVPGEHEIDLVDQLICELLD